MNYFKKKEVSKHLYLCYDVSDINNIQQNYLFTLDWRIDQWIYN